MASAVVVVRLAWNDLGIFYYPRVLAGTALVFTLAVCFLRFLRNLPPTIRFRFLLAAAVYLGGAIGVELRGSHHARVNGTDDGRFSLIATLEQSLEMAGLILFIWALLRSIASPTPAANWWAPDWAKRIHDHFGIDRTMTCQRHYFTYRSRVATWPMTNPPPPVPPSPSARQPSSS